MLHRFCVCLVSDALCSDSCAVDDRQLQTNSAQLEDVYEHAVSTPLRRFEKALQQANIAFTCIFTAEMVLKIVGLGPWRYFTDPWSLFDAAVVSFSLVEMIIEIIAHSGAEGVTALRSVALSTYSRHHM